MFRGLINDAKSAVGAVVARYATRAAVVLLFLVAAGFATAALTVQLVQTFGAVHAYSMIAGGFALLGLVAAAIVGWQETKEEAEEAAAEKADTARVSTDAAAQVAAQLPLALLGGLLATPMGPSSVMALMRGIVRNLPLVILLALIALLFWPSETSDAEDERRSDGPATEPAEAMQS